MFIYLKFTNVFWGRARFQSEIIHTKKKFFKCSNYWKLYLEHGHLNGKHATEKQIQDPSKTYDRGFLGKLLTAKTASYFHQNAP